MGAQLYPLIARLIVFLRRIKLPDGGMYCLESMYSTIQFHHSKVAHAEHVQQRTEVTMKQSSFADYMRHASGGTARS